MPAPPIRVVVADDHPELRESLRTLLAPTFDVVAAVADGPSLVQVAIDLHPDLIVSDISMPGLSGLDAAAQVKARLPGVRLVFFTIDEDRDTVAEALRRGADAYVVKSAGVGALIEAMHDVMTGTRRVSWC
ncbi:response regulator transcription factor [Luteitalea sp.]|jgi:DNA-binding NarL/FixJ family response regulator|uniref:response regulator transcription factor n=1 Tax=Luteitalea sp. TaxID=2004800 RepID=UPI0037C81B74